MNKNRTAEYFIYIFHWMRHWVITMQVACESCEPIRRRLAIFSIYELMHGDLEILWFLFRITSCNFTSHDIIKLVHFRICFDFRACLSCWRYYSSVVFVVSQSIVKSKRITTNLFNFMLIIYLLMMFYL